MIYTILKVIASVDLYLMHGNLYDKCIKKNIDNLLSYKESKSFTRSESRGTLISYNATIYRYCVSFCAAAS